MPTTEERNPKRIYLEPYPGSPDGRMWCKDDVWTREIEYEDNGPAVEYVRADLFTRSQEEARDAKKIMWEVGHENERLQEEVERLRGLVVELDSQMTWMLHRRRVLWDDNEISELSGRARRALEEEGKER